MKNFLSDVVRAVLAALVQSVAAILFFAVVLKFCEVGEKGVALINSVIKVLSVFFGLLIAVREGKNGLLKGATVGILYVVLSFLLFALMDGGFQGASFTVVDAVIGLLAGVISGIFVVNVKKGT